MPTHPAMGSQPPFARDSTLPGVRNHPPAPARDSLLPAPLQCCQWPQGQAQAVAKSKRTPLAKRGVFRARHSAEGSHLPSGTAHSLLTIPPHGMLRQAHNAQTPAQQQNAAQRWLKCQGAALVPGKGVQYWDSPAQPSAPLSVGDHPTDCPGRAQGGPRHPPSCPTAALAGDGPAQLLWTLSPPRVVIFSCCEPRAAEQSLSVTG